MKVVDYENIKKLKQSIFKTQAGAFSQSSSFINASDVFGLPVFDAEKVIYCVNCKNRHTESCPMTYQNYGALIDPTNDMDFCSYAEKKR